MNTRHTPDTETSSTTTYKYAQETSPSAGWRVVYRANAVDPDATHPPCDTTTRGAIYDPERTERNRRKHRRGVSS